MFSITENIMSKETIVTNMHENPAPFHFFKWLSGQPCFMSRILIRLGRDKHFLGVIQSRRDSNKSI